MVLNLAFWPLKGHQIAQSDQIWSKMLYLGGHHKSNAVRTLYLAFWDFLGFRMGFFAHIIFLWESLGEPQRVQQWVSDAYPVNMGQLDQYVVFGTKSGAIQDFRTGKKCPTKVKQTPLHPPKHQQKNLKPSPNPPQTQSLTLPTISVIPLVIL